MPATWEDTHVRIADLFLNRRYDLHSYDVFLKENQASTGILIINKLNAHDLHITAAMLYHLSYEATYVGRWSI